MRAILSAVGGYAVWTVLRLVGSAGIRVFWPAEFGALEGGRPITAIVPLLLGVALSLACSLAAGITVATAAPRAVPGGLLPMERAALCRFTDMTTFVPWDGVVSDAA